jgi:hypothetical protein
MAFYIVEVDNDGFKVYNSSGTLIDPATDAVVQAIRDRIGEISATPTTNTVQDRLKSIQVSLTSIENEDFATETTLTAIKDTDGIKKIVDALPTGDNWIGRTKIGDGSNTASVIQDGSNYRLMVDVKETIASVASVVGFLEDSGGSHDMVIDGSTTPVEFTFPADGTNDIALSNLVFTMSSSSIEMDGDSFGKGAALTNGILVEMTINNGVNTTIANFQVNEDYRRLLVTDLAQGGITDNIVGVINLSGTLVSGSSDEIRVTIRDEVDNAVRAISYLTATFYGTK